MKVYTRNYFLAVAIGHLMTLPLLHLLPCNDNTTVRQFTDELVKKGMVLE